MSLRSPARMSRVPARTAWDIANTRARSRSPTARSPTRGTVASARPPASPRSAAGMRSSSSPNVSGFGVPNLAARAITFGKHGRTRVRAAATEAAAVVAEAAAQAGEAATFGGVAKAAAHRGGMKEDARLLAELDRLIAINTAKELRRAAGVARVKANKAADRLAIFDRALAEAARKSRMPLGFGK